MTNLEIEAFLAVCRHRRFSEAAKELFISQSSLSIRLKTLEDDLGVALLLRSKGSRAVVLTTYGRAFYRLALQYQEIIEKMESVGKLALAGKLRVSALNSICSLLLSPVFEEFAGRYPHIQLFIQDFTAEGAVQSIIQKETDLAFSTRKIQTDQITAIPFLSDPMMILCRKDAPYRDGVKLEELQQENEIFIKWCDDFDYWYRSTFGSDNLQQVRLELASQLPLFLSSSRKWAFCPRSVAVSFGEDLGLRSITPSFRIPPRMIYILKGINAVTTDSMQYFLTVLCEVVQKQGYEILFQDLPF